MYGRGIGYVIRYVHWLQVLGRIEPTSSFCPKIPSCPVGCGGWLIVEPERNGCFGPHGCCQLLLLIIFIVIFLWMLRPSEEEEVLQRQAALLE